MESLQLAQLVHQSMTEPNNEIRSQAELKLQELGTSPPLNLFRKSRRRIYERTPRHPQRHLNPRYR